MTDDQFTQLFTHVTKRFDTLEAKIDVKADKADTDRIYEVVDAIAQTLDDQQTEHAAVTHQVDRHDRQLHQLAKHTGVKLAT